MIAKTIGRSAFISPLDLAVLEKIYVYQFLAAIFDENPGVPLIFLA